MKKMVGLTLALLCLVAFNVVPAGATDTRTTPRSAPTVAMFEGEEIDLSQDWGDAEACIIADDGARCYRSEDELEAAEDLPDEQASKASDQSDAGVAGPVASLNGCDPIVRVWRLASYQGGILIITAGNQILNMANYNWDNAISSYTIGACPAVFYDGNFATVIYPGSTVAYATAPFMATGWDNRISSIYIF